MVCWDGNEGGDGPTSRRVLQLTAALRDPALRLSGQRSAPVLARCCSAGVLAGTVLPRPAPAPPWLPEISSARASTATVCPGCVLALVDQSLPSVPWFG